jgi:hypothetical protein
VFAGAGHLKEVGMSSEKDFERQIEDMMKAKAQEDGLDPSKIAPGSVHVDTAGPTFRATWRGATVSIPFPSQTAINEWFKDNGQYIAGALTAAACVVVGVAIGKKD